MKRTWIFICFSVFASITVLAQQSPQFSQNMFNKLAYNPGFAGSMQAICATALHRQQWVGFDGRPVTTNLSVDAGIPAVYGGVGLNIVNETVGPFDNLGLQLSYAYRARAGNGQIGTGISIGMYQSSLDGSSLNPASPGDPALPTADAQGSALDFGFGVYYNSEDAYIGLSSSHITEPTIEWENATTQKLVRHYYLISGYYYQISDIISLNPSIFLKSDGVSSQLDINSNLIYNDKLWGGISYRLGESLVILSGLNITEDLKLGVSYDVVVNSIKQNSFEFMLGYCFKLNYDKPVSKYKNPRFL